MSICPLTGQKINLIQPDPEKMEYYYETIMTGKVRISDVALSSAEALSIEEKQILTGICRNRTIKKEEPIVIKQEILQKLYNQDIPYGFEERARHLLQYFHDNGGKEFGTHNMNSDSDSPIIYSSKDEFERIITFLEREKKIEFEKKRVTQSGTLYTGLRITKLGIQEMEKGLPNMPMVGLVNQKIVTGSEDVDKNIEHAKSLFFDDHSTFESKRSACETLCFVLEPLREELKNAFLGDTEIFFRIVNDFSIRHNKERTKKIQHEEQIEWIFYSLLNTINTYVKIKRKVG